MDNKQDRQFFWNVKDFLGKRSDPKPFTNTSPIHDSIKNVMSQTKPVPVPVNEIVNSSTDIKNAAMNLLNAFGKSHTKQLPQDKNRAKNITTNIFNLHEMTRKAVSNMPSPGGVLTRTQENEFTFRPFYETQPENENPGEKPESAPNPGLASDDASLAGTNINTLDYVDMNLNLGAVRRKTTLPGVKANVPDAPFMLQSPKEPSPPSIKTTPVPSIKPAKVDAPQPSSFGADPVKLRSPLRATNNEILYGHSRRAYR